MSSTPSLFAVENESEIDARGPFAGVAMDQGIDRVLDYSVPSRLISSLRVGQRVVVPLGRKNKPARGYVVSIHDHCDFPSIKPLREIEDLRVLIDGKLMELARWMSRYYVAPLGAVIEAMIPSAVKKKIGVGYSQIVHATKSREEMQAILESTKAPKRRAILARLLQVPEGGSIEIVRLASESGATVATVRKLSRLGLISIRSEPDMTGFKQSANAAATEAPRESDIALNDDQQKTFDAMQSRLHTGFSVNLLHGVTGSGKTEIYLRCIRQVVDAGKQAIVLVPEIALTPQTVKRFIARFPRVAILHSGLTATQRHRFWQQIAQGQADVIVGARSAVFAPVPNLGMIVVDEEHEASYKSDNAPRYHARDVAIKRAQMNDVPILLGSATPSLEMWNWVMSTTPSPCSQGEGRERQGEGLVDSSKSQRPSPQPSPGVPGEGVSRYSLLSLPNRVRGLSLPAAELIDMTHERRVRRGVHLMSQRLEHLLRHTLDTGHQAILLLNRRGYSNFVVCNSCGEVIKCKYCDTTMTYHRSADAHAHSAKSSEGIHTGQLQCHYCLAVNVLPPACPVCGKKLSLFGLGTQRVEEELARKFPDLKFARVDSDTMRNARDYEDTLGKFARREIKVMLGTQMIAKGLDYPNVTLVGVISGDTALSLPDFRASERTFQLITQVAGRAGRGDSPGRVIVQTFRPDDPTIQSAIKQDFVRFAKMELAHRKEIDLPPFSRIVRCIVRDQDSEKANRFAEELAAQLVGAGAVEPTLRLRGPMPAPINRIAGYFRVQIVMYTHDPAALGRVLASVREKGNLARGERVQIDVDPVSLL